MKKKKKKKKWTLKPSVIFYSDKEKRKRGRGKWMFTYLERERDKREREGIWMILQNIKLRICLMYKMLSCLMFKYNDWTYFISVCVHFIRPISSALFVVKELTLSKHVWSKKAHLYPTGRRNQNKNFKSKLLFQNPAVTYILFLRGREHWASSHAWYRHQSGSMSRTGKVRHSTPSLPQLVQFPGWMMHRHACKQYIFWSYITSAFNAICFDENPFTCQCRKRSPKSLWVSNFALFIGRFYTMWWQWRG